MRTPDNLYYRETCAPTFAEQDFWAIRRSQPVQVDWLVSYPLIFIYLRYKAPKNRYYVCGYMTTPKKG